MTGGWRADEAKSRLEERMLSASDPNTRPHHMNGTH
jgi:hypothetical protein